MKRKYPHQPIIGVGGIVFQDEQVLLVKRGKEPSLGQWSIPGGAVRTGETLQEAVVRELFEETHLQVEVLALTKVLDRIFRDAQGQIAYHYVLVDFLCRQRGGRVKAGSDAQDALFISLQDLPSYEIAPVMLDAISRANWMRRNPHLCNPPPGIGNSYG